MGHSSNQESTVWHELCSPYQRYSSSDALWAALHKQCDPFLKSLYGQILAMIDKSPHAMEYDNYDHYCGKSTLQRFDRVKDAIRDMMLNIPDADFLDRRWREPEKWAAAYAKNLKNADWDAFRTKMAGILDVSPETAFTKSPPKTTVTPSAYEERMKTAQMFYETVVGP